jgi:hypothetical protein
MTTSHLVTKVELTSETSCTSISYNILHNIIIILFNMDVTNIRFNTPETLCISYRKCPTQCYYILWISQTYILTLPKRHVNDIDNAQHNIGGRYFTDITTVHFKANIKNSETGNPKFLSNLSRRSQSIIYSL